MKKILSAMLATATSVLLFSTQVSALAGSAYPSGQNGIDVSWPNCSARITSVPFGIVGVSDGKAYDSGNPCLKAEASHFTNLSLYANTGLNIDKTTPDSYFNKAYTQAACTDDVCGAYNYGYYAGQQIANQSIAAGVSSPNWWLDVETSNTWNADTSLNDQSIQGEYDGIHSILPSVTVGAYSTNYQWGQIAGTFAPGWPVWYATVEKQATRAAKYCTASYSFAGGQVQLVQWKSKLDQDYAC